MRYVIAVLITLSVSPVAQDQSKEPRFEVISIKSVTSTPTGAGPQALSKAALEVLVIDHLERPTEN